MRYAHCNNGHMYIYITMLCMFLCMSFLEKLISQFSKTLKLFCFLLKKEKIKPYNICDLLLLSYFVYICVEFQNFQNAINLLVLF